MKVRVKRGEDKSFLTTFVLLIAFVTLLSLIQPEGTGMQVVANPTAHENVACYYDDVPFNVKGIVDARQANVLGGYDGNSYQVVRRAGGENHINVKKGPKVACV